MKIKGVEVDPKHVKLIVPTLSRILIKTFKEYGELIIGQDKEELLFFITIDNVNKADMRDCIFEYTKYLKTKKCPDDRVGWHEWHVEGIADYTRLNRLIEKRKTRKEIDIETQETLKDIKDFREYKLNCDFIEEALKRKLRGEV